MEIPTTIFSFWAIIISLILFVLFFTIWIITLAQQLSKKKYIWFVLTLLFPFVLIFYWILWISLPSFRNVRID